MDDSLDFAAAAARLEMLARGLRETAGDPAARRLSRSVRRLVRRCAEDAERSSVLIRLAAGKPDSCKEQMRLLEAADTLTIRAATTIQRLSLDVGVCE